MSKCSGGECVCGEAARFVLTPPGEDLCSYRGRSQRLVYHQENVVCASVE